MWSHKVYVRLSDGYQGPKWTAKPRPLHRSLWMQYSPNSSNNLHEDHKRIEWDQMRTTVALPNKYIFSRGRRSMMILKVSQRFAKANQEKTRLKKLYCKIALVKLLHDLEAHSPEPGHGGKTCELGHGTTCKRKRNSQGHTEKPISQSIPSSSTRTYNWSRKRSIQPPATLTN